MSIVVIGGGCIGLGVAGELAESHEVILLEKDTCGRGASYAAAGMIAPVMEAEFGEEKLLELGLQSLELYPKFVDELEREVNRTVDFRTQGTLGVAFDQAGESDLKRQVNFLQEKGLPVEHLSVEEARELEPRLSSYLNYTVKISSERQVDNRKLVDALLERCRRRGVTIREHEAVEKITYRKNRIEGVITSEKTYKPDLTIVCAGAYSAKIPGLRELDQPPIRPVKGQAVGLKLGSPPEVQHVVRSPDVYCVPKSEGRLVVGGTMEEEGFDRRVTAGAVLELLHEAYEVLPFLYEKELLESWAGLRPASRDSLPVLGPSPTTENLGFATGHYRNGILLTPVTIQLIKEWVESSTPPEPMKPFLPERFRGTVG